MNRYQILKELQRKNSNLLLPTGMDFDIEDKVLTIGMKQKGLFANMQTDASAFEGWAICLKAWLPEYITKVIISGPIPTFSAEKKREEKHYNRFLYRLKKFVKTYKWASLSDDYAKAIAELEKNELVINVPKSKASEKASHKEAQLERVYCDRHKGEYDCLDHQLPVGLFNNKVAASNAVTSRGFIDIWGVKDDVLTVFELKIPTNKMVGIISELMFYTNVMTDVMKHQISILETTKKRSFDKLYSLYQHKSCKKIKSVFLADELHTLISSNLPTVLEIINAGKFQIDTEYSYERP